MNIVFIGSSHFGLRCLQKIIGLDKCLVTGVVTAPQTFSISYNKSGVKNILHADISTFCEEKNIPYKIMNNTMADPLLLEKVKSWNPDMFIVSGWYHMVPKSWLKLAPAYGLHASLLPDYSGGAPLVWAIINGEKETGISFFQFADGVDNGPLVAQKSTPITNKDTIKTLYDRIENIGIEILEENLPKLGNGTVKLIIQDETKRRLFPQRSPKDGKINWFWPAQRIYNFVRAQTKPYPGAYTIINNDKIKIWSCLVSNKQFPEYPIGGFISKGDNIFVPCGENTAIQITESSKEK